MNNKYFKIVATYPDHEDWMYEEFKQGRMHFGWGWENCNLRKIQETHRSERTEKQKKAWYYSQFLLKRLNIGDKLVIQHKQPLREFLLAEVVGYYYFSEDTDHDFNHIIPVKPICDHYINLNSKIIPNYLRRALTKRGQYYEIYPNDAKSRLDEIVEKKLWEGEEYFQNRKFHDELADAKDEVVNVVIDKIRKYWKVNDFEKFTSELLQLVPGIDLKVLGDSGKGWDLTLQITDPLTFEILHNEVPVQCKAYKGKVNTHKPIKDIERAIRNTEKTDIGYIAILGELTEEFETARIEAEEMLSMELERDIQIKVLTQEILAELALRYSFFTANEDD
jgi:hypothetical protein